MNDTRHLERLDILRGIACLLIIVYHCHVNNLPYLGYWRYYGLTSWIEIPFLPISELGFTGVGLFFVLSGFCIHLSSLNRGAGVPFVPFMMRRFWRIYPAFLVLMVFLALNEMIHLRATLYQMLPGLAADLSCSQNLWGITRYPGQLAGHLWSVAVEWQFYMVYPLAYFLMRGKSLEIPFCASLILNLLVFWWSPRPGTVTLDGFGETLLTWNSWMLGVVVAERYAAGKQTFRHPGGWILMSGAVTFVAFQFKPIALETFFFSSVFFAVCIEVYLKRQSSLGRVERWLRDFGLISYSAYLWHPYLRVLCDWFCVKAGLDPADIGPAYLLIVPIGTFLTIIIATVSYRYIEKPFLTMRKVSPKNQTLARN